MEEFEYTGKFMLGHVKVNDIYSLNVGAPFRLSKFICWVTGY